MVFGMVTPSLAVSGEISVEEDYGIPVEEDGGIEIEVDDRSDYDIDEDREELSVLPKQDETADETNTTGKVDGYNYNIIHLDCGRKYFSVDSIKQIIDNASAAGFNYIQLAVGNDGMRFLLDDMSLTVNGTTYDSNAVSAAIHAGNEAYYNFDVDELTETEMNTIIAYAYEKGMGVIPLINTPGHMDAILDAAETLTGKTCSYNGSVRTIDVTNTTAVAFTKAFLTKYITYFAGKGCTLFNMGADEYANDRYTDGSMGFGNLQGSGKYSYFVTYVNEVAALIKNAGMTPMAFNDGIYFNNNTWSGTFDTNIIIEYWSSGWSSYIPMSASGLADKGFKMVNTHGDYYWVLGKPDAQCSATKASGFDKTVFPGSTISNPGGSTFCIWSDYPGAETEASVITKTADTISAFGGTLPTVDSITNGGTTDPTPTPGTGDVVPVELTVGGRKEFSQTGDAQKTQTEDTTVATVTLTPVYGTEMKETPLTSLNSTTSFYIKNSEGKYLNESAQWVDDYLDAIKWVYYNTSFIGNYLENANPTFYLQYDSGWKIVNRRYSATQIYFNEGCLYRSRSKEWSWDDHEYKYTYSNPLGTPVTFTTTTSTTPESTTVTITGKAPTADLANGYTTAIVGGVTYNITVNAIKESKSLTVSSGKTAALNVPALDESIVGNTTTTFDVTIGSEYITVDENGTITAGTVTEDKTATVVAKVKNAAGAVLATYTYNVTITKENLDEVTPITVEYWITNSRTTGQTSGAQSLTVTAQTAYGEAGKNILDLVDLTASSNNRTLEFWQTKLLDTENRNNSTSGTELQTAINGDDETLNGSAFTKIRYYEGKWQVYTTDWTDVDRTQVRVDYTNNNSVTETYTGDRNQLVAYYMEVVDINNDNGESELHVKAADWGIKGNGGDWGSTPDLMRCSVSVQIVYEDNTTNPTDTTANYLESKTIVYGYWSGGRGLGTMIFSGQQNYQIYKVTAETGDMTSSERGNYVTVTSFTWDKNEETVWEGDATKSVSIGNPARKPSYVAPYDNLAWNTSEYNKNNAILIRVYVKAAATEDSLKVNYVDKGTGTNFYNYNITVEEGITFNAGFALENGALVNNTVVNYNGVTQTVNSDLKVMPEISSYYRFSNFTLEEVKRSTDGKEVWLYYTFNNRHDFVVDFGVPLHLDPVDIGLGNDSEGNNWDTVKFNDKNELNYGTANVKKDEGLDYYPNVIMTGVETIAVDLSVSSNPNDEPATHFIYLYPATNVLYEENVLTQATTANNYVAWNYTAGTVSEKRQAAEKLGAESVHGYDAAYAGDKTFSAGSYYHATLNETNKFTKNLTFTFTGTGFDVISECGPQTGMLVVAIKNSAGKTVKVAVADTLFNGDSKYITGTSGILDYQVPVYRNLGLEYDTYTVNIGSAYADNRPTDAASVASLHSNDTYSIVSDILDAFGYDDVNVEDVELVYMDENSVLNGGTGVVSEKAITAFSANLAEEYAVEPNAVSTEQNVYVDGVRIYGTLANDPGYATAEKNVEYKNVFDFAVNTAVDYKPDSFIYVEYDGNKNVFSIHDYKEQGPENEIYLTPGHGIAFALDGLENNANATVQISAKVVNPLAGTAVLIGLASENDQLALTSTEMYYSVDISQGYVTLTNDSNSKAIISISNLKFSEGLTPYTSPEFAETITETAEFTPQTFEIKVPSEIVFEAAVAMNIKASASDVAKVEYKIVDTKGSDIVSYTELTPTNAYAVRRGRSKNYTYGVGIYTGEEEGYLKTGSYTIFVRATSKDNKTCIYRLNITVTK